MISHNEYKLKTLQEKNYQLQQDNMALKEQKEEAESDKSIFMGMWIGGLLSPRREVYVPVPQHTPVPQHIPNSYNNPYINPYN